MSYPFKQMFCSLTRFLFMLMRQNIRTASERRPCCEFVLVMKNVVNSYINELDESLFNDI